MERLVYQKFVEWKNRSGRKLLMLNGARQVGKTWLLHEFARREYRLEAYVNCRRNDLARQLFAQDFNMERILRALRALTGVDITPGDTLIVLDEIQDIPEALESLKYFREDASEYHVAVAGSLLGISLHEGTSYPVGQVDEINIYPMNFEEFLLAKGEREMYKLLVSRDYTTINLLHDKYVELLRQYYYVGGMPEAVAEYVATGALNEVRRIQTGILNGYDRDFSKHAPKELVPRIRMVWKSIPSQLFRENKKFIYGALRKVREPPISNWPYAGWWMQEWYARCPVARSLRCPSASTKIFRLSSSIWLTLDCLEPWPTWSPYRFWWQTTFSRSTKAG